MCGCLVAADVFDFMSLLSFSVNVSASLYSEIQHIRMEQQRMKGVYEFWRTKFSSSFFPTLLNLELNLTDYPINS